MNKDIRLSVGFLDHPKIIKLERQLGQEGIIALLRLWLWVAQNRPSGLLSGMDAEDIEIAARWNGVEGTFNAVVTGLKLLDCLDDEHKIYAIHDWQEHNTWQSDAENRSSASRLSRMAKTHPQVYAILEKSGIKGISKEIYGLITASNEPLNVVQRLLTEASSPFLSSPYSSSLFFSKIQSGDFLPPEKTTPKAPVPQPVPKQEPIAEDTEAYRLAVLMRDTLKANLPTLREPDLQKWAQSFAVALKNDERMNNYGFVTQVIQWTCSHAFWKGNIQSPDKLREKFDQLTAKMELELSRTAHQVQRAQRAERAEWVSSATRRIEANKAACEEAEVLLFGNKAEVGDGHDPS